MAYKAGFKTTFEPHRVIQPFYTGGSVALSQDGRVLATSLGEDAMLTDLLSGEHLARIEGDGESITTLALTPDASYLITCSRSLSMRIFALHLSTQLDNVTEAKLQRTLKPHTTPVVTAAVESSSSLLATGGADGVVKVWDIQGGYITHTFHGHGGVISALHFFQVEAGQEQPTASKKRKSGQRNTQAEEAQEDASTAGYRLASGGEDGKIRIWDLHRRKAVAVLDAHVSVVRSLDYSPEQKLLLSGSRDKMAILWEIRTWQPRSTIAILEEVESTGFVENSRFFVTGGETARLRVWNTSNGSEVTQDQTSGTETEAIVDVLHHQRLPFLLSVRADQSLIMHSLAPLVDMPPQERQLSALPILRRISGTHDEVIDLAYIGPDRSMLALATNLEEIRLISLEAFTSPPASLGSTPYFGADVALLKGHTDIIITIAVDWSGHWLATGAKDNTAKLWRLDPAKNEYTCYATFTGHAESIGAVSLPVATPPTGTKEHQQPVDHPPKFLITGSQDRTVKRWDISEQPNRVPRAAYTRKAHDKDINAIATSHSYTSPLFASASQDRTVKIWDAGSGEAIGVLRGHKRGVWSVAFSPHGMPVLTTVASGGASSAKGMAVTGSGDKTVRIWSLSDYSCLRTFEGHANSVLKVIWLPAPAPGKSEGAKVRRGVQVASAAGDGLVKVWDAQSGECAATLDNHIDRVWALAVKPPPLELATFGMNPDSKGESMADADEGGSEPGLELVSGAADSTLTFWHDTTASTAFAATVEATQRVEQDQELQNHIRSSNYREAVVLALQLNRPKKLLELFTAVVNGPHEAGSFVGKKDVDAVIASLSDGQLWNLLLKVRDWNANGRTHDVAQHILYAMLRLVSHERLLKLRRRPKNVGAEEADQELAGAMAELSTRDKSRESVKDVLDGLRAYTERHYSRLEKTAEERFVLLWALQQMDDVGTEGLTDGLTNGHREEDVMLVDDVT